MCVCLRTSLYSLYKHANLPKTSTQQVLAMVWTGRSCSQPLFSLTPHFQSSCWALAPSMFSVSLLLGHFSPKDRTCFSAKGFDLTSVCHQRAAESTTLEPVRSQRPNPLVPREIHMGDIFTYDKDRCCYRHGGGGRQTFCIMSESPMQYFYPQMSVNFLLVPFSNLE